MPKIPVIVGHAEQLENFRSDIETDNVVHAYLFSGPRHLGKMTVAHWFARELLTVDNSDEDKEEEYKAIERMTHPDLMVLDRLWIEGKREDWDTIAKTSNVPQVHRSKAPKAKTNIISIDDIRALQGRLNETGTGRWRCCLIRSVERMQDAAANAFLKILEEPPSGLVFILTTQAKSSLLPTIISRTRVVRFRRLAGKELLTLLDGVPEDEASFILHLAQGAPGIVERLRSDTDVLRERRQMHERASSFWRAQTLRERLQILEPLHERGQEAEDFLLHLGLTLREHATDPTSKHINSLTELSRGLQTNAQRQLLVQRFALDLT